MNGATSSSASTPTPTPTRGDLAAQIDASCRVLLLPLVSAFVWLFISSLFALVTSVKLHSPALLANCAWLSYGHTRPAANDAFVYGFASQAGLAVALWLICRLGRATLVGFAGIVIANLFWNLGVAIGVVAILMGHTTGFEWLEFPGAGSVILMTSYLVLGACALLTLKNRTERELYPSQWYLLGALFWFPWLYTTARLLLIWFPVRGVMQFAINGWFANGLFTLWLGGLALAVLFYFIPKLVGAPLYSRTLAVLGFWSLALFGGFGGLNGFYSGVPLPAWMVSVGGAAAVLLIVPMIATVANLWITMGQGQAAERSLLGYFKISVVCYALATLFAAFAALVPQLRLTLFGEGNEQLALYGFVGLALMGAVHYIAPRLSGVEDNRFVCLSGAGVTLGIIVYAAAFLVGGMVQQHRLADGALPFLSVMNSAKWFIRFSTIGVVLIVIGNGAMLARLLIMARACCRHCCGQCCVDDEAPVKLKTAEVTR